MRMFFFDKELYRAEVNAETGRLCSFMVGDREMLDVGQVDQPLMELRMMAPDGKMDLLTDDDAQVRVAPSQSGYVVDLTGFTGYSGLKAEIAIEAREEGMEFRVSIDNGTDFFVENVACPCVQVTALLAENGGEGRILWPYAEGVLIGDGRRCPFTSFQQLQPKDRNTHFMLYPGYVSMQYMAYITGKEGLYIAAHDTAGMPKEIAPSRQKSGIRLEIRPFPCVGAGESWIQSYPIVLRPIIGGWQEASEIYRDFVENSSFPLPPKLRNNPKVPKWVFDSPVVVIYPPRSVRGTGYFGPNEFFPYVNGLKYLDDLQESIDSKLMAFLPYWEGTAPWAPPFVWPPFGGEDLFADFVKEMHERNNLIALYCSGIHWTDEHLLVPEYNMTRYRQKHGLTEKMCQLPGGQLKPGICDTIRTGYTMCCACQETKNIVYDQYQHILDADVDYTQYFDQHMGGGGFVCYAMKHGHPGCFGQWNTDEMLDLYSHMNEQIAEMGKEGITAFGAEGDSADIYSSELYFNDSRWHDNYQQGEPVPAYSYVLHEYTSNFMGNQCCVDHCLARRENPDSILYALAYAFTAGDALTLVLKSGGEIHYDWGLSWLHPGPHQEPVKKLTRNLNAMRQGVAKSFLLGGRMLPTLSFSQPEQFVMTRRDGTKLVLKAVLSSRWRNEAGEEMQVFANYRDHDITVKLDFAMESMLNAMGIEKKIIDGELIVPALDCVAVLL